MSKSQFEKPSRLSEGLGSFQTTQVRTNTGPETKEAIFARMNQERDMSKIRTIPAMPDINPFDARTRKRVVVYCRVSTDSLAQAPSFATQQRYYLNYVRRRPEWKMVAMYTDEGSTISEHPFSIEDRKRGIALLKRFQLRTLRCWRMQRYADGIKIRRLQCVMWLQKIDKLISASHIYPPDIVYHITVAN